MTIVKNAKLGKITEEMKLVAKDEQIDIEKLRRNIAAGRVVIVKNSVRSKCHPIGIGEGLRTKINANVGTSPELCDVKNEVKKALVAVKYGSDTIMDLSTAGDIDNIRRKILNAISVPLGTVPIYQAAIEAIKKHGAIVDMTEDEIFNIIEKHAKDGVDFMTIHSGVTKHIVDQLEKHPRKTGIVSRGGTFLAAWILHNEKENPLYKNINYLLDLANKYDFCISFGDGLRPGCLADASDWFQLQELLTIGRLIDKCRRSDVQAIVEGPGHLPLNHIETNVVMAKAICKGAPFYVLGPIVTDIGAGYDHIVGAIGGALAGLAGADFLCYLTPSEHLGLPSTEDVREGVIAMKIAAHSVDIVKYGEKASRLDLKMAEARAKLDWKMQYDLSIDPEKAKEIRERVRLETKACSMCGKYCVFEILSKTPRKCI